MNLHTEWLRLSITFRTKKATLKRLVTGLYLVETTKRPQKLWNISASIILHNSLRSNGLI